MLVVHGIWAYGALQVWAEDSALPARAAPRGRAAVAAHRARIRSPSRPDVLADALAPAGPPRAVRRPGPQGGR